MKKRYMFFFLLALALLSCNIPLAKPPSYELKDRGALILNFESDLNARSIIPATEMVIASYDISGTGPSSDSFSDIDVTETSYIQNDLTTGAWTVTVDAKNAAGTVIATDSQAFTVTDGLTTTVDILVIPLTGQGSLSLDLSWPVDVSNPSIVATLTPDGGSSSDLTFILAANSASYSSSTWAAGYYTLSVQLLDGSDVVWGMVEAVRILESDTSSGSWTLSTDDINVVAAPTSGDLQLNVVSSLQNPIDLTFSGLVDPLTVGGEMTVTANPSIAPDSYQWYLDGVEISGATNADITINATTVGNYRLDVIVKYGSILSSGNVTFTVNT